MPALYRAVLDRSCMEQRAREIESAPAGCPLCANEPSRAFCAHLCARTQHCQNASSLRFSINRQLQAILN